MAREVLDIFFEVFGYRGQWPLELTWHRGERAEHEPVYSSVTPDDFAKLAAHLGLESEAHGRREPVVHLRHGKIVVLEAALTSPGALDDPSAERINDTLRFARVSRAGEQGVAWRGCERLLKGRRAVRALQAKRRRAAGPTVH